MVFFPGAASLPDDEAAPRIPEALLGLTMLSPFFESEPADDEEAGEREPVAPA